jgi:hypothetical protein
MRSQHPLCAAFLRCLGINFSQADIFSNQHDPPDAFYQSAQFEVMEMLEFDRKRTDEFRNRLESLLAANSLEDTLIKIEMPSPISLTELLDMLFQELEFKAIKYGKIICSGLDALVYVCLSNRFLDAKAFFPNCKIFAEQSWRSVSFVFPPYASVLWCNQDAPLFLSSFNGKLRSEWKDPDTLFAL